MADHYRLTKKVDKDYTKAIELYMRSLKLTPNNETLDKLYNMCKKGHGELEDYLNCSGCSYSKIKFLYLHIFLKEKEK